MLGNYPGPSNSWPDIGSIGANRCGSTVPEGQRFLVCLFIVNQMVMLMLIQRRRE
jgi:hypothetical protein